MLGSTILKYLALGWIGSVILIGLLMNGEKLYAWVGAKAMRERDEMARILDLMFYEISDKKILLLHSLYLVSLFALGLFLLWPSVGGGLFFGILLVVVGWHLPGIAIRIMQKRRIRKFVLQMVDGLSLMSNAMRSGLNVPQALNIVTDELPNPISQEFALVLSQNKLGVTLEEALANLSVRMPNDDIEMFTTSVNILKETGGNLAETFDTISYTIRERIKVESKIQAMVAQGVMQGIIVVLMPFALGTILYTIDPERIIPMFTTVPGWVLLSIMMSLQTLGGYTIWKIIQVRV
jgi:tight adherence protein B